MYRSCSWCELIKPEHALTSIVYCGDRVFLCADCMRRARAYNEAARRGTLNEAARSFAEADYWDGVQRGQKDG